MLSTPSRWRTAVGALVAAVVVAVSAAPASASGDQDISHRSRWSHAEWSVANRNTKVEYNLGYDDPAGGGPGTVAEVRLSQSWCDTSGAEKFLVQRELGTTTKSPLAFNLPRRNFALGFGIFHLEGTQTRTPAGTGPDCGDPTGPAASEDVYVLSVASVSMQAAPGSEPLTYERPEETGKFYYRDAAASGVLVLFDGSGAVDLPASASAGSWFWTGNWANAVDVSVTPGV